MDNDKVMPVEQINPRGNCIDDVNDCLVKILSCLPILDKLKISGVCQKWRTESPRVWSTVMKLDVNDIVISLEKRETVLKSIISRCSEHLTHFTIAGDQYPWMSDSLKCMAQNLLSFSINMDDDDMYHDTGYKICNEDLVAIITSMRKLKYLKVSTRGKGQTDLPNMILNNLPQDIQEIHFMAPVLSDVFNELALVPNKINCLQSLTLQGLRLRNETLVSIRLNKDTLVQLDLIGCTIPLNSSLLFSNLENIEQLTLKFGMKNLDVNEIDSIACNCPKLKYFEFMKADDDGEAATVRFDTFSKLKHLNNLEHLYFDGMDPTTNASGNQIFNFNWINLKYLNLGEGLGFSVLDFQELQKYKSLEFVDFSKAIIDIESFTNIASNCLQLKEIKMNFNQIPEANLYVLVNLKKLEKINFHGCANLTGNLLSAIVANCPNLLELNISSCVNITEASLIQVGKLNFLKKLVIDCIEQVPSEIFNDFCKLQYLSCFSCPTVTDKAIMKVLDNCTKISKLILRKTAITCDTLRHAVIRNPVFERLVIHTDQSVKSQFVAMRQSSPYLIVYGF